MKRADFFALPATLSGPAGGADRFRHRIGLEAAGREHAVDVGEAAVPPTLRPLIDWLIAPRAAAAHDNEGRANDGRARVR